MRRFLLDILGVLLAALSLAASYCIFWGTAVVNEKSPLPEGYEHWQFAWMSCIGVVLTVISGTASGVVLTGRKP